MTRRYWQLGGTVLALVTIAVCCARGHAAQTFGYTSVKPQLWETERPAMEQEPGTNLYWHDPHLGSFETCRYWPPATNGCMPSWYGRAEMMALYRDTKEGFKFATLGPDGPAAIGTSAFKSEFRAGVRATIGKTLGTWYRLEASYFGSYSWDDQAVLRNFDTNDQGGIGNLYSPFTDYGDGGGVVGLDYNNFASLRFRSNLNNGELNLRRRALMKPGYYESSFLLGVRYIDIGEQFQYLTQSSVPGPGISSNNMTVDADNSMIGVQIGLLSQFLVQPRCWIDFEMKGGVYHNNTSMTRDYTTIDETGAGTSYLGSDDRNRTSFVGDLSLQFNYQFSRSWTFFAGYNAIWITGLALGPNNFESDPTMLRLGPTLLDHSGEMVYHGPNLGIVFSH